MSCHQWQPQLIYSPDTSQEKRQHCIEISALHNFFSRHLVEGCMCPMFFTRAKADCRNTRLAHPIRGVCRKDPLTSFGGTTITAFKGDFTGLNVGVILC